jgi:hypothetical protein
MFARKLVLVLVLGVALLASSLSAKSAPTHRDPCHPNYTCPSDHHTYPWNGLWCTSYVDERLPNDTITVVYGGRTYWCHRAGGSTAPPSGSGGSGATASGGACGIERWTVKTLQDRPRLLPLRDATIAYLVSRPRPSALPATRLPFERHVFRVTAAVTLDRSERDGDLHLVLSDGVRTMIAESPMPSCAPGATLTRRRQMAQARAAVQLCAKARVTGVAFFDFLHGQTGVAPNGIELHPVLSFRCLVT